MDKILGIIGSVPNLQKNKDDSLTDRISHKFTVGILIVFSVIVSARQYVGEPINCWVPAHFSDAWADYTNSYCWIKNTYYLPFQNYIPLENEGHKRDMITYYQWVPLILLIQALVFYIPCMIWRTFNARSGVDINNIVDTCKAFQILDKAENKNKALDHLTKQMYRFIDSQRRYKTAMTFSIKNCISRICCACCGRRKGNYLVALYLIVKLLYIGNLFAQFFLMNEFLGTEYHEYGIRFFSMLYKREQEDLMDVPAFPRVTMCDLKIRVLGNVQRYTVQCVLSINLFNEMIYLFLWWWMVLIAIASIFSFVSWFWKIASQTDRTRFIKKHLMLLNRIEPRNDESLSPSEFLTVEFADNKDILMKPLEYDLDTKPQESSPPALDNDSDYTRLKELIKDKYGQLQLFVHLNPIRETELLKEILEVKPEDGRRLWMLSGDEGHMMCDHFMKALRQDGIFVLRIVGNNTNSITITEVVCALWDRFCERYYCKLLNELDEPNSTTPEKFA